MTFRKRLIEKNKRDKSAMMMLRKLAIFLIMLLFFGGCDSCGRKKADSLEEQRGAHDQNENFIVDVDTVFSKSEHFSFNSDITMTLNKGEETKVNRELIEIIGDLPHLHFKKKIDDFHFFELFHDGENFVVKSREGAFRNVNDNKIMYQRLLKDGFNGMAWFVEQFSLADRLIKEKKDQTIYVGKNLSLSGTPFLRNLTGFTEIDQSFLSCRIFVDEKKKLPVYGQFDVSIKGSRPDQFSIRITAVLSFDLKSSGNKLSWPETKDDEPIEAPVNIAPRFNELIEAQKGAP